MTTETLDVGAACAAARSGVLELSGLEIGEAALSIILAELPSEDEYRVVEADFGKSRFTGTANFDLVRFDAANFDGAKFDRATFANASFPEGADFDKTEFAGQADFAGAQFRDATFDSTRFFGDARFAGCMFWGATGFGGAAFSGDAYLEAIFEARANFSYATFHGGVHVVGASFKSDLDFSHADFADVRDLGPLWASGDVLLDDTTFQRQVCLSISATRVSLARATFAGPADLYISADVDLEGAEFTEASLLTELDGRRPQVTSLRRAKLEHLTISGADLSACRFIGAYDLDKLRLERVTFDAPPPSRRWTRRQTVAEERDWRAADGRRDWGSPEVDPPQPEEVGGVYRALRKGREDSRDEPGAADFYYGEMEMRRQRRAGPARGRGERAVVTLYWLVSGYGLRGSRALIALAVTIVVFAAAMHAWGFRTHASWAQALVVGASNTASVFRASPPDVQLTTAGEALLLPLRLLGLLFFGLALLSLRGRVKR